MATVVVEPSFKIVSGAAEINADFTVDNNTTYFISHPSSVATSGTYVNKLYTYLGGSTATSVTASSYPAINPFRNKPFPDNNAWSPPWTSGDIGQHRLCFNFGESVRLVGMEWKGMGNTGYVGLISGPKATTLRFGTSAFSGAYGSSTGNVANLAKQWQNLQDGSSSSSTSD